MTLYRYGFCRAVMLIVAALAALGSSPVLARSPVVTAVKVSGSHGVLKVQVAATGEVSYRVLNLSDPRFNTVVEIFPAQLSTDVKKTLDVNAGLVEKVRVGQFSDNPDIVRLVLDVSALPKYQIAMAPGRKGLTVAVSTTESVSAKATTADTSPAKAAPAPAAAEVSTQPGSMAKVGASAAAKAARMPVVQFGARRKHSLAGVAQIVTPDVNPSHTYVLRNTRKGMREVAQAGRRRGGRSVASGRKVSLDFVGADLIYVLKILAKEMNLNLVTDNTVKGSVTMSLKDVAPQGALALILKIAGFDAKVFGNTLVVGSPETLSKIPPDIMGRPPTVAGQEATLPIPLEHAKADSVAETIKSVYPEAKVTVQKDQNFVVVTGPKSQLVAIKEFVQKLDVPPPPPVVLKTEIVPVKYATVQTTLQLAKSLYPSLNYAVEDRLNSLIVTGQDRDIEALKAFLATVDIPLQQVMLDIRVVDLNENGSKTIGATIGSTTGNFGVFGATGGTPVLFTEQLPGVATSTTSLAIGTFARTPFAIGATLSMLISRNDAKVVSTPRIMTTSGKEASVLIGDKFPIVYFDPRAGQFQVQYVDIGVKLLVKPVVAADGFVTVDLAPEVSTLKGLINNQYPQTGITTVKTNVRVRDGDTIIVGGLLRELEQYTMQKLPFLGDLPVLGELFRNTSVNRQKGEVFITITPKIMP